MMASQIEPGDQYVSDWSANNYPRTGYKIDSRTRTRTGTCKRFDCPFLGKILRRFTTQTINPPLC